MGIDDVIALRNDGAVLLDSREPNDFAAGHLRGVINVGLQRRFAGYAGDVLAPDQRIVLVGDPVAALETKIRLGRIGFDQVIGQLDNPGRVATEHPELIEPSSRLTIGQLAERMVDTPGLVLIDVRGPGETASGTLTGATEIPLPLLVNVIGGLDSTRRAQPSPTAAADSARRSRPACCARRFHGCVRSHRRLPSVAGRRPSRDNAQAPTRVTRSSSRYIRWVDPQSLPHSRG